MSGLKMRFGGDSTGQAHSTDFSHLENNPNYKPEETSTSEEVVDAQPAETEVTGDTPNNIPDNTVPTDNSVDGQSSLTNNDPKPEGQPSVELTDDILFKTLSEKLGKDVTSFDELVSKPAEIDPQVKALNEWKEKTGRPIEDYFRFQKDFSQASDLEVAREFLQIQYPTFTKDEIDLELEQFIVSDDDLDTDEARKKLNLKKYAIEGRKTLESMRAELGEPSTDYLTPEVKEQVNFAKQIQQEILANQEQQKQYAKSISEAAMSTEAMKLNLSDELSIDFKVSEQDRQALPSFIDEMPHWRNEDGSWNHKSVVEDSIKIKYFDDILKLVFQQGVSSGTDDVVKQAKNSTLGSSSSAGANQPTGQTKPVIEGIDRILGKQSGMKLKFGN